MDSSIQLLISGYLDSELSEEEAERLARLLGNDAASLDRFVFQGFIHSQLLDWMDHQRMQDRAMTAAFVGSEASNSPPISSSAPTAGASRARPWMRSLGALAALLLVAVSIPTIIYVIASRPMIVGQLTHTAGSPWGASQADIPVGTLLQNGQQLTLVQGSALVTFASGAQILVEGPASLRLNSAMEVHLHSGRIAAKVPRHAIGFTVSSSLGRFVDLGTEFTLTLDSEKTFELHVFEGLVELWLDKRFGEAAQHPVRVAEVRAVSFDVTSGDVAKLDFEDGKKMPF